MRQRKVIRATRSPMNERRLCLDLECGHELWVSDKRAPKLVGCHECPTDPDSPEQQAIAAALAARKGEAVNRICHYCKQPGGKGDRSLRPYGPGGADVCAGCVLGEGAPPERKDVARKALDRQLFPHEPLLLDAREQVGPRPLKSKGKS